MALGDYLALAGLLISAFMYISFVNVERKKKLSAVEYFLSSHKGTRKQFGPSFAAASTSLATVFIFFVAATPTYGVYLFWCGISYFIGQFLFLRFAKASKIETANLTTNAKFWLQQTGAPVSSTAIRAMTIMTFVVILFLEFYIGSEIIYYYVGTDSSWAKVAGFAFIVAVVVAYVRFGGMSVVLKSDRWQYSLMVAACALLVLFAILYRGPDPSGEIESLIDSFPSVQVTPLHLMVFLAWIGLQNITLPFTQLSSWQRLAAMKSVDTALAGFRAVGLGFFALWLLPVVALLLLAAKGAVITDVASLFDTIKSMDNFLVAAMYAIIFVGFASALFSTADSAMIALELSMSESVSKGSAEDLSLARSKLNTITVAIALALIIAYHFAEAKIFDNFLTIIFVLFSQLAIIASHMFLSLYRRAKGHPPVSLSPTGDLVVALGIWLAWAILNGVSLFPATFNLLPEMAPMIASFVGLGVGAASLALAFRFRSAEEVDRISAGAAESETR